MRVAIVSEQPENVGSTYFRAIALAGRLEARGATVDLLIPRQVVRRRAGRLGRARFFAELGVGYMRRVREVRRVRGYDALLVQRGVYPIGPAWIVDRLRRAAGPARIVFDLDDAIDELPPSLQRKNALARWLYGPQQGRRLLQVADAVVVSTDALAGRLLGRAPDAVLPTVPDLDGFPAVEQSDGGPLRVGWVGNAGNRGYLDPLRDVFARLAAEGVATLRVVSAEDWDGPSEFQPWRRVDEPTLFGSFDVGIMPLPDTRYTQVKAGFKLLQYMAASSAVVASPVGVNRSLVERSGAGVLADTPAEWEAALRALAADRERRASLGAAGRRFIEGYSDLDHHADVLIELMAGGPRGS
jgi:glycosyltransferase involved in cell wall biosynthesis